MKPLILGAMTILLLSACPASAQLSVNAGNWYLAPNTANQMISISISGVGEVTNATVCAEIVGGSSLPSFTGEYSINGTIFASNGEVLNADFSEPQLAYLDMMTLSDTVDGNGLLAKLMVSTVGVAQGHFALNLLGTGWGDTDVVTDPEVVVTCHAGSINIVPEPGTLVMLAGSLALLPTLVRRRKQPAGVATPTR